MSDVLDCLPQEAAHGIIKHKLFIGKVILRKHLPLRKWKHNTEERRKPTQDMFMIRLSWWQPQFSPSRKRSCLRIVLAKARKLEHLSINS